MDHLTHRLLVTVLPLVGFIYLGRGIASFTSGDKADVRAVASISAAPVRSRAPHTQSTGERAVTHPKGRASMRRLPRIDTPSSKPPLTSVERPLAGPPRPHEQKVQRLDDVPTVQRLDSFPEVERIDSESHTHSVYQSMAVPPKPTLCRFPPLENPTLFAAEDSPSETLAEKQTNGTPSVRGVAVKPERRREDPARATPLELINPHFKATPAKPTAQVPPTSETLMRIPPRESTSPEPSIHRSLEVPESPTLVSEPLVSEKPTGRSYGIPDVVSKREPVAANGPAPEELDDSRFTSRYGQIPSETIQPASEATGSPRTQDPQQPHQALSAPEQDPSMPWSPIDLRNMELSDDLMQSKLAPQQATPQTTSADKKRAREALLLGFELARRGSYNSSHARFIEALQIVARSLDKLASSNEHTLALRRGLRAYEEAVDFQARSDPPERNINLNILISRHITSVLHAVNLDDWNREQCLREYMTFAEREIVAAVGREPLAAQALYGLGRLQAHLQVDNSESANVRTHRALMLYQAALIVDPRHYFAANELGDLLARYGQLKEAITALRHCVRLSPQPFGNPTR